MRTQKKLRLGKAVVATLTAVAVVAAATSGASAHDLWFPNSSTVVVAGMCERTYYNPWPAPTGQARGYFTDHRHGGALDMGASTYYNSSYLSARDWCQKTNGYVTETSAVIYKVLANGDVQFCAWDPRTGYNTTGQEERYVICYGPTGNWYRGGAYQRFWDGGTPVDVNWWQNFYR